MIVCDDVETDPSNRNRINTLGLSHSITPIEGDDFPVCHPQLCVFVSLTGGVGIGQAQVVIRSEETDEVIRETAVHTIENLVTRNLISGVLFRILDCVFEEVGVYWIEFVYEGLVLSRQSLFLRSPR